MARALLGGGEGGFQMKRSLFALTISMLALGAHGCTADAPSTLDGAVGGDAACLCDDGLFCNGEESCAGGACVPGTAPCDGVCDEERDACGPCETDADGDDVRSMRCGGTDCDDDDPTRYPGNDEVCDAEDHDEDCDPSTFGFRDTDSDTFADAACCNEDGSTRTCGDDCDDAAANVHPTEAETCNSTDDDCDGHTDEGVLATFYPDADGDHYGNSAAGVEPVEACSTPEGYADAGGDCDDTAGSGASIHPGALEACDGPMLDEDCDGARNEACGCPIAGETTPCCSGRGRQTCVMVPPEGSEWSECSQGSAPEICNGIDDDCDGSADEMPATLCAVTGQTCTGGSCVCTGAGEVACGGHCQRVGDACDGDDDLDDCPEGSWVCPSGALVCDDRSGDSGSMSPQCGIDLDCDGDAYERVECDAGTARSCQICGTLSGDHRFDATGTQACNIFCGYDPCMSVPYGIVGIDAAPALSPWVLSTACGGTVSGGRDYGVPYTMTAAGCGIVTSPMLVLRPGRYDVVFDHHDSSVLVTPAMTFQVPGTGFSRQIRNTTAGWQGHAFSFSVTGCVSTAITIRSDTQYYDGSSGGLAGWYRGGDTLGNVRITGPF